MGFSRQEYWSGLPFPSPLDHVLSELFTITRPSWVALHCMVHSFIELDLGKRPWCWERLKAGGERDDRGWDGWMASPTQWTWVWANSGSWCWTGKPGVLQSMGPQRVGYDWVTELNWILLVTREMQIKTRMKYCFLSTQMAMFKILTLPNVGKVVKQLKYWYIFVEV